MGFDMLLISTTDSQPYVPSARSKGNDSLQQMGGNWSHKFLRNSGFYLNARNPIVQLELISGYTHCLLEFGEVPSGHLPYCLHAGQRLLSSSADL